MDFVHQTNDSWNRHKEKREIEENRTTHLKEEGKIVKYSSVRDKFLKPLKDLEHLREYRAAGRVLLQILMIFLRGRI